MGSLYWTKRTPLDKDKFDTMVANDYLNYIGVQSSQSSIIGFRYSFSGEDYTGTNWEVINDPIYTGKKKLRHHWHVVKSLDILNLQMTDIGLYRISAWQSQVFQAYSNLAPQDDDTSKYVKDGWEVSLILDGRVYLTTQIYGQSGHQECAYPESYLRIYRPEKHSFQVMIRPYSVPSGGGSPWPTTSVNRDALTISPGSWPQAATTDRIVWGDSDAAGSDNRQLTGYHMVQYIGS